jgi:tRNA-2-methylthio-N6-dimethylallyladenosine synthase
MNMADSERMAGVLESVGYECTTEAGEADVLIYNTCSIREKAEVKVYSALGKQVPAAAPTNQQRSGRAAGSPS